MNMKRYDVIDVGEYKIIIDYKGDGELDVRILDELGDEVEGIYISNDEKDDDIEDGNTIDINLN